jgi:transposase InsO family protein
LTDRSRRPQHSPGRSSPETEAQVLKVRKAHPTWGGRKIKAYLERKEGSRMPSPSTITAILRRNDKIDPEESRKHRPFQRFAMEQPNQLWQMDFKGYFALEEGGYCHPLTVLDDHSRFLVGLRACPNETYPTVQAHLTELFHCYGLPERMLMDNGSPWGDDADSPDTILTAWLIRLGIQISHGHPYHPQTQGKDERLHRTLQEELLELNTMTNLPFCQLQFDDWRERYNCERPHEALQMQVPISHYQPSLRPFPPVLPPILYKPGDIVRKVDQSGKISFHNRAFRVGKAFHYNPVALRPTACETVLDVFFCSQKVAQLSLRVDNC